MGLSRQFVNLIMDNRIPGAKSLRCIDLRRHKLFNTTIPVLQQKGNRSESELPWADNHKNKIGMGPLPAPSINFQGSAKDSPLLARASTETSILKPWETPVSSASHANDRKKAAASITRKIRTIQLPKPIMNFRCSNNNSDWCLNCLPFAGRKVLCVDASSRDVLFDVSTNQLETIPYLNTPKHLPLPCWVPHPSSGDAIDDGNGSFYILEGSPYPEYQGASQQPTNQFEAFVYHSESMSWQRQLLPPPPFVDDPKHYENYTHPIINSYAVVDRDGGSHVILVSFVSEVGAGTCCLDTATHTWRHVGDWVLPFKGKVEYVPELKLWFGFCTEDLQLGAADLSTMDDSQPQIVGTWKELEAPANWRELKPPQLVNLGFGRFCITRFFFAVLNPMASSVNPMAIYDSEYDDLEEEYFTVFTGIDVVPCVHEAQGKLELQMIKHNSRRHISYGSDGNIELVF